MNLANTRSLILVLLLSLAPNHLFGQRLQASLSHYSTDMGLASNAIAYITQDDFGYIWIATWNGLSRFDGYHFYNYETGAGSHIPNLHNRILDLAVDNQQNIWMRMYDNRVFVLRRAIDQIVNPFEVISGNEEFRSYYPITVTSSGYVLINIDGVGLYKMKPEGDKFAAEVITTAGFTVTSMAEGYQNDIWLGTDKGVHRMDISNLTIERKGLFLDEQITCLYSNGYNIFAGTKSGKIMSFSYGQQPLELRHGGEAVYSLFVDSWGMLWFTDAHDGANKLNPETGEEKVYQQRVLAPDLDGGGGLIREARGTVWVRMSHGGYGYYNRQTDEVEYFHNDPSNPWNLSNTVNANLELNEGVVFESTSRRGLEKLEIMEKIIGRYQLYTTNETSVSNEIRALCYDNSRHQLLIGNKAGQLFAMRGDTILPLCSADQDGKPFGRIYGLATDSKGNYWLSSKDNGLYKLTPTGNGFSTVRYWEGGPVGQALSSNSAYQSVEDRQGNIWLATYAGGVNLITKAKNGKTVVLNSKNGIKNYPHNSHMKVRTVAIDHDGVVWAGTTDGILLMSYRDGKVSIERLLPSEEEPEQMLRSNDVVCLALDPEGSMWVGTNGGGLAHTIGKDSQGRWLFEHFGARDGLPGEEIRSITFDRRGNTWFATDHELCSYNNSKRIFTTFSNPEGVDGTMCSEGGAAALPGDDIIFGTLNGYYKVERKKLTTTAGNVLKLRITDFFLNGELQSPRLNDNFDSYVPECSSIVLPSHQVHIAFRFASLNYQLQHRVHYQYMLEGYDHAWINADNTRTAHYDDLPAGRYTFKVKAFLLESPEKFDLRKLEVEVPSVFIFSSQVIWIYMLLLSVGLIVLMFRRQRQLAKAENMRALHEGAHPYRYENQNQVAFIQQQHEYLELHISEQDLKVETLIEMSGMTEEGYAKLLYQITQMTPREFVADYRLKKALGLLENSNDLIADIVFKCGYRDVGSFTREMKKKLGMTPSGYRDMLKRRD